jgi:hypothetical protein
MKLNLGDVSLPLDFATQTTAILARKRMGKTYLASVMAEELAAAKLPFVVLDPTGAWWGLRSIYPVVIIGGAHGDVPLEPTSGKVIAELVVEHPGFYVIDMSLTISNADQDRFATDFAERLYRVKEAHRFPMMLFVDEADSFAPQRPFPGQQRMLGAFEAIVRRGGIRGLGITMITQRPAVLNKNVLTQCEMLVVLQMTGPQDQAAVDDWVKRNGTKEQRDQMMHSLASLKVGEAWIWSPSWLELFKRVKIRERHTFNSSATPKVGDKAVAPPELAPVDLEKLGKEIAATVERAKENDPAVLRRRIRELEQRKVEAPKALPPIVERIEVPVITPEQMRLLEDSVRQGACIGSAVKSMHEWSLCLSACVDEINRKLAKEPPPRHIQLTGGLSPKPEIKWAPRAVERIGKIAGILLDSGGELAKGELAKGELAVLTACAQFPDGVDRSQITVLTGYKRSTRDAYVYRLSLKGFVEAGGDDSVRVTRAGMDTLGPDFEPLPIGERLQHHWLARLPEGERKILELLILSYPNAVGRNEITDKTGFKRSTRDAYLYRMTAKQIIDEPSRGQVKASANLF